MRSESPAIPGSTAVSANAAYFLPPEGALGDRLLPLLGTPDFQGFREQRKLACALRKLRLQKVCGIRRLGGSQIEEGHPDFGISPAFAKIIGLLSSKGLKLDTGKKLWKSANIKKCLV
jgi:hypothetical protein